MNTSVNALVCTCIQGVMNKTNKGNLYLPFEKNETEIRGTVIISFFMHTEAEFKNIEFYFVYFRQFQPVDPYR